MGVTQRMILGNLSHVFVAPWWRSCCRAVLSPSPDLRGGWPQRLNVSHWRTDSLSLKCVFTRWGMRRTRGEKWKLHKLTLMGCRGERSGFWPFYLSFLSGVLCTRMHFVLEVICLFLLVVVVLMYSTACIQCNSFSNFCKSSTLWPLSFTTHLK